MSSAESHAPVFHGTTILCVRSQGQVVMVGDGQVSLGQTIMKPNARKVRRLGSQGKVVAGFAGATADAFTLFERFEEKLESYSGNLVRAAVELAKDWRTNKMLRQLEALLMVADAENSLILSGTGDVIEPSEPVMAIGSGGMYALAAARGLLHTGTLGAEEIATEAMKIAASICVYTNDQFTVETL